MVQAPLRRVVLRLRIRSICRGGLPAQKTHTQSLVIQHIGRNLQSEAYIGAQSFPKQRPLLNSAYIMILLIILIIIQSVLLVAAQSLLKISVELFGKCSWSWEYFK